MLRKSRYVQIFLFKHPWEASDSYSLTCVQKTKNKKRSRDGEGGGGRHAFFEEIPTCTRAEFCLAQELPLSARHCDDFFAALGDLVLENRHPSRRAPIEASGEDVFAFACLYLFFAFGGEVRGEERGEEKKLFVMTVVF